MNSSTAGGPACELYDVVTHPVYISTIFGFVLIIIIMGVVMSTQRDRAAHLQRRLIQEMSNTGGIEQEDTNVSDFMENLDVELPKPTSTTTTPAVTTTTRQDSEEVD
jgi:hypothetical protein